MLTLFCLIIVSELVRVSAGLDFFQSISTLSHSVTAEHLYILFHLHRPSAVSFVEHTITSSILFAWTIFNKTLVFVTIQLVNMF